MYWGGLVLGGRDYQNKPFILLWRTPLRTLWRTVNLTVDLSLNLTVRKREPVNLTVDLSLNLTVKHPACATRNFKFIRFKFGKDLHLRVSCRCWRTSGLALLVAFPLQVVWEWSHSQTCSRSGKEPPTSELHALLQHLRSHCHPCRFGLHASKVDGGAQQHSFECELGQVRFWAQCRGFLPHVAKIPNQHFHHLSVVA